MDRDEWLRILKAFEDEGSECVLVGATALAVHGSVRATEGVDFFIRATADNVERLKKAFRTVYTEGPNSAAVRAGDLLGEYPSGCHYPPAGDLYFDILTRLGEFGRYEDVERETKSVAGIRVRVATLRALYDLKTGTVRAIERQDADALRQRFRLEDR